MNRPFPEIQHRIFLTIVAISVVFVMFLFHSKRGRQPGITSSGIFPSHRYPVIISNKFHSRKQR